MFDHCYCHLQQPPVAEYLKRICLVQGSTVGNRLLSIKVSFGCCCYCYLQQQPAVMYPRRRCFVHSCKVVHCVVEIIDGFQFWKCRRPSAVEYRTCSYDFCGGGVSMTV